MKVCLVDYEHPATDPSCGGGGRVTALLDEYLSERGHEVRIVTDNADASPDPRIRGPDGGHWSTFAARSYSHAADCVEWADVVNGHFSLPSSMALPRLCSQSNTPLAISVMGADIYDPSRFDLIRPAARRVNARMFEGAQTVIAPSSDMHRRVANTYSVDPDLIRYGIDISRWTWRQRSLSEPVQVTSVCRIIERKNIPTAIQAVRELRERGYNIEYTAVGSGDRLAHIRDEYDHLDWLSLPGYVDDLQSALDSADIFMLPTIHEAFGIVYLEALAAGLPVVTTANGGQSDIVQPSVGKTVQPAEDKIAFADALEAVLDEYESYQAATERYVDENFSAEQMAVEYESLFQELLHERDTTQRVRASH